MDDKERLEELLSKVNNLESEMIKLNLGMLSNIYDEDENKDEDALTRNLIKRLLDIKNAIVQIMDSYDSYMGTEYDYEDEYNELANSWYLFIKDTPNYDEVGIKLQDISVANIRLKNLLIVTLEGFEISI